MTPNVIVVISGLLMALCGADVSDMHRQVHWPIGPSKSVPQNVEFRVAIVSAGELRSFTFAEKSWQKYIFEPWKKHVFFFAHVVRMENCPTARDGLSRLAQLATDFEVASPAPYVPTRVIWSKLPEEYSRTKRWTKVLGQSSRGNFIDMHARRARAYELAKNYAASNKFEWDLIVFTRLDAAFYEPGLNFYQWHQDIIDHNTKTSARGIFVHNGCNYHGPCDRFAVGLPSEMDLYFEPDWPFRVLEWIELPDSETNLFRSHLTTHIPYEDYIIHELKINMLIHDGNSEHLMELWFIIKNLTQIVFTPIPIAFATLRTEHADAYCTMHREQFSHQYPDPNKFIWDPDKQPMYGNSGSIIQGFDTVASSLERCGKHVQHFNVTSICSTIPSCKCQPRGLYANV